jgi:ribose 5-phosphate isomerase B
MKIAIAGDSAGEELAKRLARELATSHEIVEVSRTSSGPDPYYANLAERIANGVLEGLWDRAVLICGTGIGVSIAANKVPGIRAALCHDTYSAERAALSNNAQIITLGARVIGPELAKSITLSFLSRTFDEDGASRDNVAAINAVDRKYHPT